MSCIPLYPLKQKTIVGSIQGHQLKKKCPVKRSQNFLFWALEGFCTYSQSKNHAA